MQMREAALLTGEHAAKERMVLEQLRTSAQRVARGSLNAATWGTNKSRVFSWLESIMRDIAAAPRRAPLRCRAFKGVAAFYTIAAGIK
jgi:hypothetical protein